MMAFAGRNVLITGASSGLGLAVSKRFADLGAHTILVCRSGESGEGALAEIRNATPDASVHPMICDLASMASIERFLSEIASEYDTLDLLFNNAGVMKRERTLTEDGFETMFQVNYLAPFIFMNALLEQLRDSPTHLVLNNGRPSAKLRLDFDDLQFAKRYRMYNSFFRTKLCLLLAGLELAQRPESEGVSIHEVDPGPFTSGLVREVPWPVGWVKNLFSATVDEAADNIMYVAGSDEARLETGEVFKKRQPVSLAPYWQDADTRERLWEVTEAMIQKTTSR